MLFRSVITGICKSSIKCNKIFISSRNNKTSKQLKKKFKRIVIERDNQKIVSSSNWVFLAVTPTVGEKIIKNLRFRSNQTIISFISTITIPNLKKLYGNNVIDSLIISMTKSEQDILNLYKICSDNLEKKDIPTLTPLIEEIEDLKNADQIIEKLLKNKKYLKIGRAHV